MNSLEKIKKIPKQNGVIFLSDISSQEENNIYLKVREKEGRIYSDEIVKHLPEVPVKHKFYKEWKFRKKPINKLKKYISLKNESARGGLNILDLGCGNGWMSNNLAFDNNNIFALDLNLPELEQAARVFPHNPNLNFIYGNIFEDIFPGSSFNLIIAASSIQYFRDLKSLVVRLKSLLKDKGEIHLIDSNFYTEKDIDAARKRTVIYYNNLGFQEMKNFYFHHSFDELKDFKYEILFNPNDIMSKILKVVLRDSRHPFPWIVIKK